MPFLLLKLLGIGRWLREAATACSGWMGRNPWQAAVIALCALSAWLWHGNNVRDRKIAALEVKNKAQADMFNRASAANLAAQQAQVKALEAKYTEQAKENVRVETQVRTVYRDRAADNAERMRLDKVCRRPASGPGENPTAPQPDSPGATAVVLARDDYDILVENSARLEAAHRWAKSLIEDGTAEVVKAGGPEVGFGQRKM